MLLAAGDGHIVDLNLAAETALGYTRAELLGRRPLDLGLWRHPDARGLLWTRLRSEGRLFEQSLEFVTKDGTALRVVLNAELLDTHGSAHILCLARLSGPDGVVLAPNLDLTSFRSLFMAAAEGIYRSLPEGGLIDVNPALVRIFGYDSIDQMLREFPRPSHAVYVDEGVAEQLFADLHRDGQIENRRTRVRRRDGSTIWINENLRSVRDQSGQLLFVEGSVVDITRQEAAETALRQSEELYRILVDNCRDGVFLIQRGKVEFTNGAMADMLGYSVGELLGSEYMELVAPESRAAQMERRVLRESGSREVQGYEINMLCKDGSRRLVQVRADPVVFDGDIASTGTARDITEERAQQRALAEAERKYRQLFRHSVIGLFQAHPDGRVLEANAALGHLFGYASRSDLLQHMAHIDDIDMPPEDRHELLELLRRNGQVTDQEVRIRRYDGRPIWVSLNVHAVRDAEGRVLSLEGAVQDVTARRDAERALLSSEERYRTLVEHAQIAVYVMRDERYIYVNQRFANLTGYDERELIGMHWNELASAEGRRIIAARVAARGRGEVLPAEYETFLRRKGGRELRVSVSAGPIRLDDGDYFSGTVRDVTERHRFESELEHNATHDALTGLPNRVLFERHLTGRLGEAQEQGAYGYAVLFLDLDGFKLVNDSLGHATGDRLLVEIVARLRGVLPEGCILARYGGDEFTMLPRGQWTTHSAEALAHQVLQALGEPFVFDGHRIYSGASLGIVLGRAGYDTPEQVLRDADTAMYRAKARGKSAYMMFDEAMHRAARERLRLETDLREAVERQEFRVHFQPLVDLRSGAVVGCEALLRWLHPERGLLQPPQFLDVAEETGLIVAIDWWVLEQTCAQLKQWQQRYPAFHDLRANVNVDDRQFAERDVAAGIGRVLQRTGLAAASLAIEVTETVFRSGRVQAEAILREVKQLGVSLVVDDFGTGYSSLDSFASSPFDALKIDRSFVRDMETNRRHRAIVRTVSGFAEDLGLSLTAEGVETAAQAELLLAMGCSTAQGYLYAPALPAAEMEQLLAAGSVLKRRA
ncbi:PAS domain S-box-containing protein/diguanylate cyclase (GGDEF)-like protein [Tahibacter aquaticus]|uniref:PAS domain S-box-containing protein/diguanylate cyclase (GGDEF)-like protein n=2 Tax=Tahibacter aquaticus TaxID=520092 RepID=A0A4R6YNE7_9GAMM|nr:PAS domain S-box-containing protein/diguanylate cyclase (GGDEF)-like protein [Tahibacter aquaticus]